jgi:methyl-accepting chemotaxis protein-1 (serine sensor receptor)
MLKNLSIKARLIVTMGFMGVMLLVGGVMGLVGLQKTNDSLKEVYTVQLASSIAISNSQVRLLQARTTLDRAVLRFDAPGVSEIVKRAEDFHEQSETEWKKYLALPQVGEEKKLSDEVAAKREVYLRDGGQALISAIRAGQREEADRLLFEKIQPLFSSLNQSADALSSFQLKAAAKSYEASQAAFDAFRTGAMAGALLGLIVVAMSAFFLMRAITQPLQEMLGHFDAIADGNLTSRIEVKSKDEMGMLMRGLQKMQNSLTETVRHVRESSMTIGDATGQIAAGNLDLSSRTEQQASSLEETASSMEELTSTVKQNADNARQANQLAISASEVAVKGGEVVSQVVETMSSINESAKKIVDIISVIDGIAFQTNILALNAAVEAARAGEQGRGFAVVASEVRNLAQRSAGAAKEIKALIGNSVEKVDVGSKLVEQAGATMHEVVASVKRVTDIMGEITSASQEQSAGIEQVNQAITQMDQVTQQNAALVEEAAAAAESLRDQAGKLAQVVSVFKLNDVQTAVAAPIVPERSASNAKASIAPLTRKTASKVVASPQRKRIANAQPAAADEWEQF